MCNAPLQVSLDTGHDVLLRPVGIEDESKFQQIFRAMSPESRYLRFFSGANPVPDAVVRSLADADGHKHIAWGILDEGEDGTPLMAAAHAIRSEEGSDRAELAAGCAGPVSGAWPLTAFDRVCCPVLPGARHHHVGGGNAAGKPQGKQPVQGAGRESDPAHAANDTLGV